MNLSRSRFIKTRQKQRGDFLIESLVGMVLMGIVGMGVVHIASRVSVNQQDMRLQEIAVNQVRAALMNHRTGLNNVCSPTPPVITLPNNEATEVEVHGCGTTIDASIGGNIVPDVPRPLIVSVKSPSLGQVVVGGTWPKDE